MAATQSCAQKTLARIGAIRGNLAFLSQPESNQLSTILNRFAVLYRMNPNAMTKATVLARATPDDSAGLLVKSLDQVTADASLIRGINHVDSAIVNPHLQAMVADCKAFALAQDLGDTIAEALTASLTRLARVGFDGGYAGSARRPVSLHMR